MEFLGSTRLRTGCSVLRHALIELVSFISVYMQATSILHLNVPDSSNLQEIIVLGSHLSGSMTGKRKETSTGSCCVRCQIFKVLVQY